MRISDWSSDVCSSDLIKRGVYPEARRSEAQSTLDSAEAVVVQAEAALEEARQALGPSGAENPRIRDAIAALAQANLDLQRTVVVAPTDGGVTNLSLTIGQVLVQGEAAMTYIAVREVRSEEHTSELQSLMRTSYAV